MDYFDLNEYTIRLLDNIENDKLESLDTLVYTSSLFVIPINIAAFNGRLLLMNIYIFLALTSWAHHACRHMKVKNCIYDEIDKFACVTTGVFLFMYTFFYRSLRTFIVCILATICIFICYTRIFKNRKVNIKYRGLKNWKYQKPHILMHFIAVLTGSYVALND